MGLLLTWDIMLFISQAKNAVLQDRIRTESAAELAQHQRQLAEAREQAERYREEAEGFQEEYNDLYKRLEVRELA